MAFGVTAAAIPAIVGLVLFQPSASVQADHNSLYLVCPDSISEGDSANMSVKRPGYRIKHAVIFTHEGHYSAGPEDFLEYHGVKFETKSGQNTLRVPIETTEDSAPGHDETFAIGFKSGGVWHQCVITIKDYDAPEVSDVEVISEPVDGFAYRTGEAIDVVVNLDFKADVAGTPLLSLFLGDESGSTWRDAEYHSGSGSRSIVFRYHVKPGDMDTGGVSVSSASVSDDRTPASGFSGSINAAGTDVPINYTHPGVDPHWRQKVDGRPYVQSARITSSPMDEWDAYRANQAVEITLTFNVDVVVEGDVSVDLYLGLENYNWDEATRQARYIRGFGTDTLVFAYAVRPGDMDSKGIGIILGDEDHGIAGNGSIKSKDGGVDRNPWYLGTNHQPEHRVDTEPPSVSYVSIASSPADGTAYAAGEIITAEVTFDEGVNVRGDVRLELDVGGESRQATLLASAERGFTSSLDFEYTISTEDIDQDGVGIGANSVRLNGGGICDSAGNPAGLSHDPVASDPQQKVAGFAEA